MEGQTLEKDTKNAKIMLGIFIVLTLLFVCGGGFVVGVAGSGSETDGVNAAMGLTGPMCCSISGLLAAALAMLAMPTKPTAQLVAPVLAGIVGGVAGAVSIFMFFAVIWPSL